MTRRFVELDWCATPLGELVLRRRWLLMSSMFTVAEVQMARLAITELPGTCLDVVVGGLGLGYTAHTVLENKNVGSLVVVDALAEVINWHQRGLLPAGEALTSDPRCTLVHGHFFDLLRSGSGLDAAEPGRRFHAIVVDIDHSPRHLLHPSHAGFYEPAGLRRAEVRAEIVTFHNPLQAREAASTVYLAKKASAR